LYRLTGNENASWAVPILIFSNFDRFSLSIFPLFCIFSHFASRCQLCLSYRRWNHPKDMYNPINLDEASSGASAVNERQYVTMTVAKSYSLILVVATIGRECRRRSVRRVE